MYKQAKNLLYRQKILTKVTRSVFKANSYTYARSLKDKYFTLTFTLD